MLLYHFNKYEAHNTDYIFYTTMCSLYLPILFVLNAFHCIHTHLFSFCRKYNTAADDSTTNLNFFQKFFSLSLLYPMIHSQLPMSETLHILVQMEGKGTSVKKKIVRKNSPHCFLNTTQQTLLQLFPTYPMAFCAVNIKGVCPLKSVVSMF